MNQRNQNNQRTMGQRGARILIWLCVLVAQSLYAASVLKLAGTAGENWIIVTLSLALVCVGMLMGFNFAGAFGLRRVAQNAVSERRGPARPMAERVVSQRRERGWESKGKPSGYPVRENGTL